MIEHIPVLVWRGWVEENDEVEGTPKLQVLQTALSARNFLQYSMPYP